MTTTSARPYGRAFSGNAPENYERHFVPAIGRPLATDLVAEAALRPGERVLDVACGTGVVARLAAERVGPRGLVAGADVNPGMLAVARTLAPSGPVPIQWYETSAESMPLPGEAFDVVFCQLGLQFMADRAAALKEMRRVLAPGGRAYVSAPQPTAFFAVMHEAFARHRLPAAGFVQLVFSLGDPRELQRLGDAAGFTSVDVRVDTKHLRLPPARDFLWEYVVSTPMAGMLAELPETVRTALEREVEQGWQPWVKDGGLTHEQPILVATARK